MGPIAVLGTGNSGLAMAAHLALNGGTVRMWNRSEPGISELSRTGSIQAYGVVSGEAPIDFVSTDIAAVIEGCELILVTTPANGHRDSEAQLAPRLCGEPTIILNPGRPFGALEVAQVLQEKCCAARPTIAEAQTIIYTCRRLDRRSVQILALKRQVLVSCLASLATPAMIASLPVCMQRHLSPAASLVETSLGNVGMVLHCLPILLNTGWIESPKTQFKYYYEGITPSISNLLEKLDSERTEVAEMMGHPLESLSAWLRRSYQIQGEDIYTLIQNNAAYQTIDAPQSLQHRYVFEDVPCGLVPLEALGRVMGLPMRVCTLAIDLACEIMDVDFRMQGRNLERLGLGHATREGIRRSLADILGNQPPGSRS